jgi:hypothetical protein
MYSRWYSHFINVPPYHRLLHPTIKLAMMKMGQSNYRDWSTKLACLDSRVLIQYHPIRANSRDIQDDLIKTRMRIIYNITEARHFAWSGYPSEPMLAEAAARLLNGSSKFIDEAPLILDYAFRSGFLARGERGELVARTLFTVAHDLAIIHLYPDLNSAPRFHRPIWLLPLLKNLVNPAIWEIIRNAKPFHAYPEDKTLEEAFSDSWVHFSHFVQLGDHGSFTLHGLSELLKRGGAAQTYDNQYNMNIGLPVLVGDPAETVIELDRIPMPS